MLDTLLQQPSREYLLLGLERASEPLLGEVVLDGSLLGTRGLGEGSGAAERTGESGVLHADNADVAGATDGAGAGHTLRHLDSDGEVHDLRSRQTTNSDAGNVLGDLRILEGSGVLTTGGGVNLGGEGTGTVLVDLVEDQLDLAIVGTRGHALGGGHTSGGLDGSLLGAGGGLGATVGGTGQVDAAGEGLSVEGAGGLNLGGVACGAVHEGGDHLLGIDWATSVGAAESGGLGGADLLGADDGGVGLSTAAGAGAITGRAVSDGQTRQVHTVGALDLSHDTVSEDVGGSEGRNEDG